MTMRLAVLALLLAQGPARPGTQFGTVSGRILNVNGTPARGLRVGALVPSETPGTTSALLGVAQTNDDGRYQLQDVPAGRYHIAAGPLDSLTYFPGASSPSKATIVAVEAGKEVKGIDFSLVKPPGLLVSGIVINENAALPGSFGVTIGSRATGGMGGSLSTMPTQIRLIGGGATLSGNVKPDGTFEITNVKPGTYQAAAMPASNLAPMTITVEDSDVTNVRLVIRKRVNVTGIVEVEGGGQHPYFWLALTPVGETQAATATVSARGDVQRGGGMNVQLMGSFRLSMVPGEYRVTPSDIDAATVRASGITIKSMTAGNTNLLTDTLKVTPAGAPVVRIVLSAPSDGWKTITGRFVGRGVPGSAPKIILMGIGGNPYEPPTATVYMDGSFVFEKILPGTYQVRSAIPADSALGMQDQPLASVTVGPSGVSGLLLDTALFSPVTPISKTGSSANAAAGVRVRGHIAGRTRWTGPATVTLKGGDPAKLLSTPLSWDGTFEFSAVPNGTYEATPQPPVVGAKPLTISVTGSGPVSNVELRVPSTREVLGRVSVSRAGLLPRTIGLTLAADGVSEIRRSTAIQSDGTFVLTIAEGVTVRSPADQLPAGYAVESITYAGRDVQQRPISFNSAEAGELSIRLNTDRVTTFKVSGRMTGAAAPESRVWLTSSTRSVSSSISSMEAAVQADRTFSFYNVLPGNYAVRVTGAGIPTSLPAGSVRVADRDIAGLEVAAPHFVSGRVIVTGGGTPPRFSLPLQSATDEATLTIEPQPDGSFRAAVPLGIWQVAAPVGLPAGFKAESIAYGATDITKSPLRVAATDSTALNLTLSRMK